MNSAADKVIYRIRIHTGECDECEDTDVSVTIVGEDGSFKFNPRKRHAVDGSVSLFLSQSENVFEVASEKSVGYINLVQVDHNVNPLLDRSWRLESITIEDTSLKTTYHFPCNEWFSHSKDNCRQSRSFLDRKIIPELQLLRLTKGERFEDISLSSKHEDLSDMSDDPATAEEAKKALEKYGIRESFSNWGGNVSEVIVLAFYPHNRSHVKKIIKNVKKASMKVRVYGTTHSWTNLYPDPNQILIRTEHFMKCPLLYPPRITLKDESEESVLVTIVCSVTTAECKFHQILKNYNFPFNTVVGGVTYGGIIGTGCHGVGKGCQAHPDLVEEITLIDGNGDEVTYTKSENEERLKAVTTSMGLFGFICNITFRVLSQQRIVVTENDNESYTVLDTLTSASALKALAEKKDNYLTEVFWFPYNSNAIGAMKKTDSGLDCILPIKMFLQLLMDRSPCCKNSPGALSRWVPEDDKLFVKTVRNATHEEEKDERGPLYYRKKIAKEILRATLFQEVPERIAAFPEFTPLFTTFAHLCMSSFKIGGFEIGEPKKVVQELPHAIHYKFWVTEGFPIFVLEFAFAIDDDYENIAKACQDVVDVVKKFHRESKYPMSMCFEMRFMSDSNSFLCPAVVGNSKDRDKEIKVAYIEILALASKDSIDTWTKFAQEVADKWMNTPGVKPLPHWGKAAELGSTAKLVEYLWDNNKENMEKFLRQLKESKADPDGIFFNKYLRKVFRK
ncbi:uncharacterized protein [Oscarella lobularis]